MDPCINQFDKYGYKCRELALQYACMYSLRYIDFYVSFIKYNNNFNS